MESFLLSLPPLEALDVDFLDSPALWEKLIDRHGATLRCFEFGRFRLEWPSLSHDQVRKLARQCPRLERILLPVRRSKSDHDELKIYEALGSLPRLKSATLHLVYS
jgi:hypothetical protein